MTETLTAPPKKEFQSFHDFPIITDLDNTLWGGIIGDDGVEGIEIGPEEATGQVYSEFQKYIK